MTAKEIIEAINTSGMCCKNCVHYIAPNTPIQNYSGIGLCGKDSDYFFAEIGHVEPDFFCNRFSDKDAMGLFSHKKIPEIAAGTNLNDI